jgi:hypothetical protein
MVGPLDLRDLTWFVTFLLKLTLLFFIVWRKLYRSYPIFLAYVIVTVLQTLLTAWALRHWGAESIVYVKVAWGMQGLVVGVRWLAVAEIARRVFSAYSGIRRLSTTVLSVVGVSIFTGSILIWSTWAQVILHVDRAVELCIAVFIVGMFLFVRYYGLVMTNLQRQLAVGFCLFSCSWVVLNSVFQNREHPAGFWFGFFQIVTFFATLLIWIAAVRAPVEAVEPTVPVVLSPDAYRQLSGQLNARLLLLNDRLNHLLRSQDTRS